MLVSKPNLSGNPSDTALEPEEDIILMPFAPTYLTAQSL